MLKHLIALIALSILVILAMVYVQTGVDALLMAENWVAELLKDVFSGGTAGNLTRELLALLCIPFVIGFIPTLLYWLARRRMFPYFMNIVWVVWLVQVAALIIRNKAPMA